MKLEKVLKIYGTQVATAQALGLSQPTIANWRRRGAIPPLQQLRIEAITGGKLKADAGILRKVSRV